MYLTKLLFQNDNFKEEKHLQRIVGDPEDLQYVYEYNIKIIVMKKVTINSLLIV